MEPLQLLRASPVFQELKADEISSVLDDYALAQQTYQDMRARNFPAGLWKLNAAFVLARLLQSRGHTVSTVDFGVHPFVDSTHDLPWLSVCIALKWKA